MVVAKSAGPSSPEMSIAERISSCSSSSTGEPPGLPREERTASGVIVESATQLPPDPVRSRSGSKSRHSLAAMLAPQQHSSRAGPVSETQYVGSGCRKCGLAIATGVPFIIESLSGDRYHQECFLCIACGKQVDGVEYKPTPEGPQCLECALPQCHQCKNLILGTVCIAKTPDNEELHFHTQCLRCIKCGHGIQHKYKAGPDGFLCRSCANPHCERCRKIIDGGSQYFLDAATKAPTCADCHRALVGAPSSAELQYPSATTEVTTTTTRSRTPLDQNLFPMSSSSSSSSRAGPGFIFPSTGKSATSTTTTRAERRPVSTAYYAVVAPPESNVVLYDEDLIEQKAEDGVVPIREAEQPAAAPVSSTTFTTTTVEHQNPTSHEPGRPTRPVNNNIPDAGDEASGSYPRYVLEEQKQTFTSSNPGAPDRGFDSAPTFAPPLSSASTARVYNYRTVDGPPAQIPLHQPRPNDINRDFNGAPCGPRDRSEMPSSSFARHDEQVVQHEFAPPLSSRRGSVELVEVRTVPRATQQVVRQQGCETITTAEPQRAVTEEVTRVLPKSNARTGVEPPPVLVRREEHFTSLTANGQPPRGANIASPRTSVGTGTAERAVFLPPSREPVVSTARTAPSRGPPRATPVEFSSSTTTTSYGAPQLPSRHERGTDFYPEKSRPAAAVPPEYTSTTTREVLLDTTPRPRAVDHQPVVRTYPPSSFPSGRPRGPAQEYNFYARPEVAVAQPQPGPGVLGTEHTTASYPPPSRSSAPPTTYAYAPETGLHAHHEDDGAAYNNRGDLLRPDEHLMFPGTRRSSKDTDEQTRFYYPTNPLPHTVVHDQSEAFPFQGEAPPTSSYGAPGNPPRHAPPDFAHYNHFDTARTGEQLPSYPVRAAPPPPSESYHYGQHQLPVEHSTREVVYYTPPPPPERAIVPDNGRTTQHASYPPVPPQQPTSAAHPHPPPSSRQHNYSQEIFHHAPPAPHFYTTTHVQHQPHPYNPAPGAMRPVTRTQSYEYYQPAPEQHEDEGPVTFFAPDGRLFQEVDPSSMHAPGPARSKSRSKTKKRREQERASSRSRSSSSLGSPTRRSSSSRRRGRRRYGSGRRGGGNHRGGSSRRRRRGDNRDGEELFGDPRSTRGHKYNDQNYDPYCDDWADQAGNSRNPTPPTTTSTQASSGPRWSGRFNDENVFDAAASSQMNKENVRNHAAEGNYSNNSGAAGAFGSQGAQKAASPADLQEHEFLTRLQSQKTSNARLLGPFIGPPPPGARIVPAF
ncbi:unnamed protein product [Amoebophrya sp. A120]|nr:unnamed protein product [Amoebophrya sp. A120]|eukprot:GSA120T00023993001.1